jgi:hypothetical protein
MKQHKSAASTRVLQMAALGPMLYIIAAEDEHGCSLNKYCSHPTRVGD